MCESELGLAGCNLGLTSIHWFFFLGREMGHGLHAGLKTGGRLRYCMLTNLSCLLAAVFVLCV